MGFNLLKLGFSVITFSVLIVGFLINSGSQFLPSFIKSLYLYGKLSGKRRPSLFDLQVPKRWFLHFYIFSSALTTLSLFYMVLVYIFNVEIVRGLVDALDILRGGPSPGSKVAASSCLIALSLLTIQTWKRLYETGFVSIFSDGKMHLNHYLIGYFHYVGATFSIFLEAPVFGGEHFMTFNQIYSDIKYKDVAACFVFFWAWYHQLNSAIILANLRKNKKGEVVNYGYNIPMGGLFDWVSSPHLLCEILIYTSLTVILQGNSTWIFVFMWVLINQVACGLQNHWWYKSKFENYPNKRYAVIPFIL